MRTKRLLAAGILLVVPVFLCFAGGSGEQSGPEQAGALRKAELEAEKRLELATDLKGFELRTFEDEKMGEVEELVVELSTGHVVFAVFRIGDRLAPVPVSFLLLDRISNEFLVDLQDMDTVENAPSIEALRLADTGGLAGFTSGIFRYWSSVGINPPYLLSEKIPERGRAVRTYGPGMRYLPGSMMSFSNLLDQPVSNQEGATIGMIEDLVVFPGTGRIAAFLFSTPAGRKDSVYPLPVSAFSWNFERNTLTLTVDPDRFRNAPRLRSSRIERDLARRDWEERYLSYWIEVEPAVGFRSGMRVIPGEAARSTRMLGLEVTNWNGRSLGTIRDAVVREDGAVPYVMVEFTGDLLEGLRQRWYPVPTEAFTVQFFQGLAILGFPRSRLLDLPGFPVGSLPEAGDPRWREQIRATWDELLQHVPGSGAQEPPQRLDRREGSGELVLLNDLLEYTVENYDGELLGRVDELVVNLQSGRAAYLALDTTTAGLGAGKLLAVPFEAVELDKGQRTALVQIEPAAVRRAQGFDPNDWPLLRGPNWDAEIRSFSVR